MDLDIFMLGLIFFFELGLVVSRYISLGFSHFFAGFVFSPAPPVLELFQPPSLITIFDCLRFWSLQDILRLDLDVFLLGVDFFWRSPEFL